VCRSERSETGYCTIIDELAETWPLTCVPKRIHHVMTPASEVERQGSPVSKKIAREADFLLGQKIKPISETNHESTPPESRPPKRPSHDLPGPDSDDRPPRMQLHVLHTAHRLPVRVASLSEPLSPLYGRLRRSPTLGWTL
jgi:hypothetical protein